MEDFVCCILFNIVSYLVWMNVSASAKKYVGNFHLARRLAWVAYGFMDWEMKMEISSCLVLCDFVLYAGPSVGDFGGGGVGFLARLSVHAAIGFSSPSMSLSELLMRLGI